MFSRKSITKVIIVLMMFAAACQSESAGPPLPEYWPTDGWRTAPPSQHNIDAARLEALTDNIKTNFPFLDSLIIIRQGYIVYEAYFNGYNADEMHDIASITKSWTSALIGMAQAQGKLANLDEPIDVLLPEYFVEGAHADKQAITLAHLLTMRSGIDFDEDILSTGGYGGEELLTEDITEIGLGFPMAHESGTAWNYSTLDAQLTSAIFETAMDESLSAFAAKQLFDPLGIKQFEWLVDGTGTTIGGRELSMTPRDMAKLGLLYLHNGVWDDAQLVPTEWVKHSLTPQEEAYYTATDQIETIEWYGYYWWLWKPDWFYGYRSFQARGYAGQQVLVFPALDLMIITTANIDDVDPQTAAEQEGAIYDLIRESIFPALSDVDLDR